MKKQKPLWYRITFAANCAITATFGLFPAYAVSDFGRDSLCGAAYTGNCWAIRLFIAAGANPSRVGWEDHFTPLGNAVRGGQVEAARLLLAHGADPNAPDDSGHTAIAAQYNYSEADSADQARVVALLRQAGGH